MDRKVSIGIAMANAVILGTITYILLTTTSCSAGGVDPKNLEAGISQFLSTSTENPSDTAIIGKDVSDMRDLSDQTYEEMVYVGSISYILADISYQMTELIRLFSNAQTQDTNWLGSLELRFGLLRMDIHAVYALNDSVPARLRATHLEYVNACADYERFMNLATSGIQDMNQDAMAEALGYLDDAANHITSAQVLLDAYNNIIIGGVNE